MSARRQRIKAAANLSQIKRKARKEDADIAADAPAEPLPVPMVDPLAIPVAEPLSVPKQEHADEDVNEIAFKMPAVSSLGLMDDVFHSDIEDNVIQMDLQKTANGFPMSPSKAQARQRVRPTPVFGQRRNSFVGSPLAADYDGDYQSPGTPTRRERYLSGSSMNAGGGGTPQQQMQASPKYLGSVMSPGMGRIRTESSCSVFSDSGGVGKQRKGDGEKSSQSLAQQRVNAKRDFETRFNNGVPDKSTFKMFDMIFYNPDSNPMEQKPLVTTIKAESANGSIHSDEMKPPKAELMETKADVGAGAAPHSAMPVPQLKLDANGEMIIDEKTLEIETTAEVEARKVLANSSLILMDETTGDNGFYKRHKRTPAWSSDDTVRFYRSLQIIGTDFSLMCQMFPKRTRRELKLKYKREERMNGQLINKALLYPKAFNIQELKEQLEKEDQERLEAERQWQEIVATQPTNVKKRSKTQQSKGARTLSDGDLVYENEQVLNKKLGKHALAKRRAAMENGNTMPAAKRKRRPLKQKQEALQLDEELEQEFPSSYTDIKREGAIKTEQLIKDRGEQLQQELNSLLDDEETDDKNEKALHKNVIDMEYVNEANLPSDATDIDTLSQADTIFTIDFIGEPSPLSTSNSTSVSEHDIEQILTELAEGSMVLVSSIDPNYEDRIVNEIYMYDKQTGDLCEQPLDIPEHIVQSILNVMS
ncbi:transcription factor TFIIIB component B'' homolog isoform X2 [Drosophila sulfurigaster albostrigata]|uniref:transcription factor TFIIIB component B'' homolog isoform X2 n=1 Tax=Drosophila sulfurigaster albostrigata TaxID=89887 RepID=UPI002D218362|nr:transcription factor TFIIIB component B'' homolog isoform X2 [Drosophila sulfurigaster albostrigata]